MDGGGIAFKVAFGGATHLVTMRADAGVAELREVLHGLTGVEPEQQTALIFKGKTVTAAAVAADPAATVGSLGIRKGYKVVVIGTAKAAVEQMWQDEASSTRRHDARKRARQQRPLYGKPGDAAAGPASPYTFQALESLQNMPAGAPTPAEAMGFLQRIRDDRGVRAIMEKHRWTVGKLTEFAPSLQTGIIGLTGGCLLGFNKNRGQEISLRLRTDDFMGFRHYRVIMQTVLHELAHMVHDEHETPFWTLNSQLNKEYKELDPFGSKGRNVGEGTGFVGDDPFGEDDAPGITRSVPQPLGGGGGGGGSGSAAEKAREAAMRRMEAAALAGAGAGAVEHAAVTKAHGDGCCGGHHHTGTSHERGHTTDDLTESAAAATDDAEMTDVPAAEAAELAVTGGAVEPDGNDDVAMESPAPVGSRPTTNPQAARMDTPEDLQAAADVLGIAPGASEAELKKAFRKLAFRQFPDRMSVEQTAALERARNAYERLVSSLGGQQAVREGDNNYTTHAGGERTGMSIDAPLADPAPAVPAPTATPNPTDPAAAAAAAAAATIADDGVDITSVTTAADRPDPEAAGEALAVLLAGLQSSGCSDKELDVGLAVQSLLANAAGAPGCLGVLTKIVENLRAHPAEPKYKSIKVGNSKFRSAIQGCHADAIAFLTKVGFSHSQDQTQLVYTRNDPGLLWLASSLLSTASQRC